MRILHVFSFDIVNIGNCPDCFEVKYRTYANLFATWLCKVLLAKIGEKGTEKHNSTSLSKS